MARRSEANILQEEQGQKDEDADNPGSTKKHHLDETVPGFEMLLQIVFHRHGLTPIPSHP